MNTSPKIYDESLRIRLSRAQLDAIDQARVLVGLNRGQYIRAATMAVIGHGGIWMSEKKISEARVDAA